MREAYTVPVTVECHSVRKDLPDHGRIWLVAAGQSVLRVGEQIVAIMESDLTKVLIESAVEKTGEDK